MIKNKRRAVLATAVALIAVAAPSASAEGANVGFAGTSVAYGTTDLTTHAGVCKYVRVAVGVGGGGITYHVAGAATAGGTYRGIPVVATGVRCRLLLSATIVVSGPEYLPGPVAETDTSYTTNDAGGGLICTKVYAVLRQTPPGEPDNLIEGTERCA